MRLTEKEISVIGVETGFYRIKKDNSNSFIQDNCENQRELNSLFLGQQKLGQLEDIEEELGIDLLTLFKALENGVWIKDEYSSEIRKHDVRGVFNGGIIVISRICSYAECDFSEYSCDYGKTWALTKEELK